MPSGTTMFSQTSPQLCTTDSLFIVVVVGMCLCRCKIHMCMYVSESRLTDSWNEYKFKFLFVFSFFSRLYSPFPPNLLFFSPFRVPLHVPCPPCSPPASSLSPTCITMSDTTPTTQVHVEEDGHKVFVGNLSFQTTEAELSELFSKPTPV